MENEYTLSAIFRLISGTMLILAIGVQPASYYLLLRWIVAICSLYSGWLMSQLNQSNWAWALFIVGVIFNPIIPLYLDRLTWQILDVLVILILFSSLSVKKKTK